MGLVELDLRGRPCDERFHCGPISSLRNVEDARAAVGAAKGRPAEKLVVGTVLGGCERTDNDSVPLVSSSSVWMVGVVGRV